MFATLTDVAAFITSIVTAAVLLITTLAQLRTKKAVEAVHQDVNLGNLVSNDIQYQVTTLNGKTIAVLADDDETRRVLALPKVERTEGDEDHLVDVPPPS